MSSTVRTKKKVCRQPAAQALCFIWSDEEPFKFIYGDISTQQTKPARRPSTLEITKADVRRGPVPSGDGSVSLYREE